jgi:hypothetical protein
MAGWQFLLLCSVSDAPTTHAHLSLAF